MAKTFFRNMELYATYGVAATVVEYVKGKSPASSRLLSLCTSYCARLGGTLLKSWQIFIHIMNEHLFT
jgi:hypothetical protein